MIWLAYYIKNIWKFVDVIDILYKNIWKFADMIDILYKKYIKIRTCESKPTKTKKIFVWSNQHFFYNAFYLT